MKPRVLNTLNDTPLVFPSKRNFVGVITRTILWCCVTRIRLIESNMYSEKQWKTSEGLCSDARPELACLHYLVSALRRI